MLSLLVSDPSVVVGLVLILAIAVRWFAVPADARRTEYILLIAIFTLIVTEGVASRVRMRRADAVHG